MRKLLCVTGVMAAVLMAGARPADASMIMRITDAAGVGGGSATCNNDFGSCATGTVFTGNGAGTFTSAQDSGFMQLVGGVVGHFTIGASTSISNGTGAVGGATIDTTNLVIVNTAATLQTLTIDMTGMHFTLPAGPFMRLLGSAAENSSSANAQDFTSRSFADPTDTGVWTVADGSCTRPITLSSGSCVETPIEWNRGANASFAIRNLLTINLGAGQSININSSVLAHAVPEPASMLLLGTGLIGLARSVRRRRKAAAV